MKHLSGLPEAKMLKSHRCGSLHSSHFVSGAKLAWTQQDAISKPAYLAEFVQLLAPILQHQRNYGAVDQQVLVCHIYIYRFTMVKTKKICRDLFSSTMKMQGIYLVEESSIPWQVTGNLQAMAHGFWISGSPPSARPQTTLGWCFHDDTAEFQVVFLGWFMLVYVRPNSEENFDSARLM